MPRARGEKPYLSMAGGLMTEASPLAFPENYTADELNFLFDRNDGKRIKRKGLEALPNPFTSGGYFGKVKAIKTDYWQAADLKVTVYTTLNTSDQVMFVFQDPTDNTEVFTFATDLPLGGSSYFVDFDFNDTLLMAVFRCSTGRKPLMFSYDGDASEIEVFDVDIYIRDFKLLDDSHSLTDRPVLLNRYHAYNIYNAGWWSDRGVDTGAAITPTDPVTEFFTETARYPSNSDIAFLGVNIANDPSYAAGKQVFDVDFLNSVIVGSTEAPRGHYVFEIGDVDRDAKVTDKDDDGVPSTTLTYQWTLT